MEKNTSLAVKGALAHRLQNPNRPPRGPKMADGVSEGHFKQLLLNEFFDPSTPSLRKGRDGGGKNGEKKKRLIIIVATT